MLQILDGLPSGLLEADSNELYQFLDSPTLIHLDGEIKSDLFISVLLHGNEDTGWVAVRRLLKKYPKLPRNVSLFIGNVAAARYRVRRLENQPDYNRIWSGSGSDEHRMAEEVLERMRRRNTWAAVDLHNTTGRNPHYACINKLEQPFLALAANFSRRIVYFLQPENVISQAFAHSISPSVTLECGQPGNVDGIEHAYGYLERLLNMKELPAEIPPLTQLDLLHTMATVRIPPDINFGFDDDDVPLRFVSDLDRYNFHEMEPGTVIAHVKNGSNVRLVVEDENGRDLTERYFEIQSGVLRLKDSAILSLLTMDAQVIRQDCLCYLMERYQLEEHRE